MMCCMCWLIPCAVSQLSQMVEGYLHLGERQKTESLGRAGSTFKHCSFSSEGGRFDINMKLVLTTHIACFYSDPQHTVLLVNVLHVSTELHRET